MSVGGSSICSASDSAHDTMAFSPQPENSSVGASSSSLDEINEQDEYNGADSDLGMFTKFASYESEDSSCE
eukprot:7141323-Karenia_brevis.AAC.1